MGIGLKNRLAVGATPVPDVFIDTYMAGASGEYVKVYLYLLRHQQEEVSIGQIADALNHTEADVQRALAYWQRAGVLGTEVGEEAQRSFQETPGQQIPGRRWFLCAICKNCRAGSRSLRYVTPDLG